MPKKSAKQQVDEAVTARMEAARESKDSRISKDVFVFVEEPKKKLAPQAKQIVALVQAAGEGGISRTELTKAMEGVVVTRQPQARILTYYQKSLLEAGVLRIIGKDNTPAAETDEDQGKDAC